MKTGIGSEIIKISGLRFGGGACPHCEGDLPMAQLVSDYGEGEARRIVARHPEGWQHIFSPNQLWIGPVDDPDPPALLPDRHDLIRDLGAALQMLAEVEPDCGEPPRYTDQFDALLNRYRAALGAAAMGEWTWWVCETGDDCYRYEASSREAVIRTAVAEIGDVDSIDIVRARPWVDDVTAALIDSDGDGIQPFAQTSDKETIPIQRHDVGFSFAGIGGGSNNGQA